MLLYLHAKVDQLRLSIYEFFETAYMWRFQKVGHVVPDYIHYVEHAHHPNYDLPKYVKAYLAHLQQEEVCTVTVERSSPSM